MSTEATKLAEEVLAAHSKDKITGDFLSTGLVFRAAPILATALLEAEKERDYANDHHGECHNRSADQIVELREQLAEAQKRIAELEAGIDELGGV